MYVSENLPSGDQTNLKDYTKDELKQFLESLDLQIYVPLVENDTMTGKLLSVCEEEEDLKLLGVENKLHARLLLKEVKRQRGFSGN